MKTMVRWSMPILVVAMALSGFASEASAAGVRSAPASDSAGGIFPAPSAAPDPAVSNLQLAQASGKHSQGADLRDEGYNTQYLFGMTKGIVESTLNPGLKPLMFIFTVPLDIVTLPFTAIAGFF
jgi:hypothetical protein